MEILDVQERNGRPCRRLACHTVLAIFEHGVGEDVARTCKASDRHLEAAAVEVVGHGESVRAEVVQGGVTPARPHRNRVGLAAGDIETPEPVVVDPAQRRESRSTFRIRNHESAGLTAGASERKAAADGGRRDH